MPADLEYVLEAIRQLSAGKITLGVFALVLLVWGGKQIYSNAGGDVRQRNIGIALAGIGLIILCLVT